MRKLIAATVSMGAMLFTTSALAEEPAVEAAPAEAEAAPAAGAPQMLLGADLAFQMPVGDWSDATGPQFGALLKLEYPATPNVGITGRAGFLYGLKKEVDFGLGKVKTGVSDVPVWAGVRYYFMEPQNGLHAGVELGLNYLIGSSTTEGTNPLTGQTVSQDTSASEAKFGAGVGAGYRIDMIDIRAGLNILDIGHAGDSLGVMVTVGYDFMQF